ncbi:MAG: transporter related [Glaciihabitans sp.]|nr:transporter related [Glaciihabitans sp.]
MDKAHSVSPVTTTPRVGASDARPLLELRGLTAGYGDLSAVRGLSLVLHPGEIVALFGANGAGKTTALLASVGVLPLKQGSVLWQGSEVTDQLHKRARSGLCFVPVAPSILKRLTTRENLMLGRGGVDRAVGIFPELSGLLDRPAGLLSGGEQQILSLARALAAQPSAILVDELSLGLAPQIVERLLDALRQAALNDGLAVLLVEQQVRRALAIADRWYLLGNGELIDAGLAKEHAKLEASYLAGLTAARSREGA